MNELYNIFSAIENLEYFFSSLNNLKPTNFFFSMTKCQRRKKTSPEYYYTQIVRIFCCLNIFCKEPKRLLLKLLVLTSIKTDYFNSWSF